VLVSFVRCVLCEKCCVMSFSPTSVVICSLVLFYMCLGDWSGVL